MKKDSEMFSFIKNNKDWTVIKNKGHELNYLVQIEDNIVYLFFQESDGKKDWKDNLDFIPIPCKVYRNQESHMICHRGFVKEYKSGNDQIMAEVIAACELLNNPKVVISGWSNGAAMATLAAEDFFYRYGIRPTVVTFGNPKVCFDPSTALHILLCCETFREYCNRNDIVTKVPPIGWHVNRFPLDKKHLFGIFDPWKYHCNYDEVLKNDGR